MAKKIEKGTESTKQLLILVYLTGIFLFKLSSLVRILKCWRKQNKNDRLWKKDIWKKWTSCYNLKGYQVRNKIPFNTNFLKSVFSNRRYHSEVSEKSFICSGGTGMKKD